MVDGMWYAGAGAVDEERRYGLVIGRVRLPADELRRFGPVDERTTEPNKVERTLRVMLAHENDGLGTSTSLKVLVSTL